MNWEDEGAMVGVFFIEVRFVIHFWRPLGIGYDDKVPLLSPQVSRVKPRIGSVTNLECEL